MNATVRLTLLLAALMASHQARPDDTLPDPLFGDGGTVAIEPSGNDVPQLQPIVLLQGTNTYVINHVLRDDVYLSRVSRLDAFGNLDPNYGTGGHTELTGLDGFYDSYSWSNGVVDAQGRLYTVGQARIGANADMLVCRLRADGQFDGNWGGNTTGCTTVAFDAIPAGLDSGTVLALQANGRLLVGGLVKVAGGYSMGVARLNAAGGLDPSFNGSGKTIVAHPNWKTLTAGGIAEDSEQRVVLAGTVNNPIAINNTCDEQYFVSRLLPDGTQDDAFPPTDLGWDLPPPVPDDCLKIKDFMVLGGLAVDADDSITLIGNAQLENNLYAIAVAKITKDLMLDPSFGGGDGKISRLACDTCGSSRVISASVAADGRIVAVGRTHLGGAEGDDVFVTRLLPDGNDDPAFAGSGALTFDYGAGTPNVNDLVGVIAAGAGRIVFPVISEDSAVASDERLLVTALGDIEDVPVLEIAVFADGFE
ncbi:delta-60 repeat domain-containing protein [Chiayiivirga flava]|uniref:Putative delta-60 repeat protein n=1 Tax=Chiayiivirga flava TaxID=659595 RepID=A0A7W8FZG6_9GAMM|nr:delta-60 repeat domain-containing protein [Chiayiivirga flava]MBB5208101.1 putative delta-60 repeat protein [Chiayiivirga flava]